MANDKIPQAPPAPPAPSTDTNALADAMAKAIATAIKNTREDTKGLSPEQRERLDTPPTPKKWREVRCRSDETGATFTALVVESKTMVAGRIVELKGYTHPKGIATFVSDGGLVPNGMQILRAGTAAPEDGRIIPKHDLTPYYLQWRWETFWQADLRRFAGKELKRHVAIDDAAFSTPWQEGTIRIDLSEDDAA